MKKSEATLSVSGKNTWNICMLAHVDHGKSALSDCLISSNGIISHRLAGKMRYMDSRADEQMRGITMKSSSIALAYGAKDEPMKIVHLVDSPGHVDFSGEVEAALRVCDGALVVVDVVEGVCVQTETVLRAAMEHFVKPVLVLNKIDRLFTELKHSPLAAYRRVERVIESVNVIMGLREVEQRMAEADRYMDMNENHQASDKAEGDNKNDTATEEINTKQENEKVAKKPTGARKGRQPMKKDSATYADGWVVEKRGEESESGYFSPEKGNVAFASAIDGWAFRISDFATIFSKRTGIPEQLLRDTLWGDYYIQMKSKRVILKRNADTTSKSEPLFAKFIMSSIHSVYDAVLSTQNDHDLAKEKRKKIVEKLGLKVNMRDLGNRDAQVVTHTIMSAWLPASKALLDMVIDRLPSVSTAQAGPRRLGVIWPHGNNKENGHVVHRKEAFQRQHEALKACASGESVPVMAVVTKMIEGQDDRENSGMNIRRPKTREQLAAEKAAAAAAENNDGANGEKEKEDEKGMIAFARILSGSIKVGDELYAYGPRYLPDADGLFDEESVSRVTVTSLHLLMGRSAEPLKAADAGCIVGIGGVEKGVLKTATLSTEKPGECLPAGVVRTGLQRDAVVRVAVEPHLPNQLAQLKEGLRKLNLADPSVETTVTSRGEYLVGASGELHLERCLKDLRENFAKGIKIHVSKPIVSFRETVVGGTSLYYNQNDDQKAKEQDNEKEDEASEEKNDQSVGVISPFLENSMFSFGALVSSVQANFSFRMCAAPLPANLSEALDKAGPTIRAYTQRRGSTDDPVKVRKQIMEALKKDAENAESSKISAVDFEEQWTKVLKCVWSCGPKGFGPNLLIGPYASTNVSEHLQQIFWGDETAPTVNGTEEANRKIKALESAIMTGFQLGSQTGPLADEPMHGVAIFVDCIDAKVEESVASVSGSAMGAARECVRKAVLNGNARIMEGVLRVDVAVTETQFGAAYSVIAVSRGKVRETEKKGMNVFDITANIPIVESYGFADKLRKKTSGFATPQMVFSHWETIETDPFWEPKTVEELEELGAADSTAEKNNLASILIKQVRKKKGLRVDEKIVENAEKQRTLSRKK